jgi:CheY-like chemotaxis protein
MSERSDRRRVMRMSVFRILLVEDNEGDVEIVKSALDDWRDGCRLTVTYDGTEALDCLRNGVCAESRPDLILLDINMPRMDGKECLRNLKHDEKFRMIPVSMLTSSQAPSDILECYRSHASCYVVKPFEAREFIKVVRQLVTFWSDVARPPSRAVW